MPALLTWQEFTPQLLLHHPVTGRTQRPGSPALLSAPKVFGSNMRSLEFPPTRRRTTVPFHRYLLEATCHYCPRRSWQHRTATFAGWVRPPSTATALLRGAISSHQHGSGLAHPPQFLQPGATQAAPGKENAPSPTSFCPRAAATFLSGAGTLGWTQR